MDKKVYSEPIIEVIEMELDTVICIDVSNDTEVDNPFDSF